MSLWEKWEAERLRKLGVNVDEKRDVEIHDMHPKSNLNRQLLMVGGALLACVMVVYLTLTILAQSDRWSDLYIVRLFVGRAELRTEQQRNPPAP